jgi:drug/metabolite transporter, DME family
LLGLELGIVAAIAASAIWALASVLMASQVDRLDSPSISALRLVWASALFIVLVLVQGLWGDFTDLGTSKIVQLIAGALVGLALGDTLYVVALRALGAARAFTVSLGVFTVLTFALSALLLGETVTVTVVLGSALVIASVYLVALYGRADAPETLADTTPTVHRETLLGGIALVSVAALCWAIATVWLRHAAVDADPSVVGAIRIPASALAVGGLVALHKNSGLRQRTVERGSMVILAIAGLVGTGAGSFLFIFAIQEIGAGRTAVLTALSPLFAVPMGAIWLGESITRWVVLGTALAVAGIILIST